MTDGKNNPAKNNSKRKLNALDIFIILIVILIAAGVFLRIYVVKNGALPGQTAKLEKYAVSFLMKNIRGSSADCFIEGEELYLDTTGALFGTLTDNIAITPAETFIENAYGEYILTYSVEDGDDGRIDVRTVALVDGYMSDEGFLLGGTTYIAPNKQMILKSKNIVVNVTITDITKVS